MSILEHIISAFRCLSASKMRTFLTTLGIIVGISSVILINTIGNTIGKTIKSSMANIIQGNVFEVYSLDTVEYMESGDMVYEPLPEERLAELEERFKGKVQRQVTNYIGDNTLASDECKDTADINVFGVSSNTITTLGGDIISGRYISDEDVDNRKACVVISDSCVKKLFGSKDFDAVGKQLTVGSFLPVSDSKRFNMVVTVVGVYKDKIDSSLLGMDDDQPTTAAFPYTYLDDMMGVNSHELFDVVFSADDDVSGDEFKKAAEEIFEGAFSDNISLMVVSISESLEMVDSVIGVITTVIAAIAAISLLVGGIGVMNIMLVSVTERTMEIGVRKAMGADNKSIRMQFITESVLISLLGSVIGIVVGLVEAKLLAMLAIKLTEGKGLPISIDLGVPVSAIVGSVIFSFIVGLVFGVYPADKAAKMEVVDALRYE